MMMGKVIDLVGKTFERLTVLERAADGPKGHDRWLCRCECGEMRTVRGNSFRRKNPTRSCGCLRAEAMCTRFETHGLTKGGRMPPTYRVWQNMLSRCVNPNAAGFKCYGARGITVCERWRKLENFLADTGERPPGMSLDRIDNNGNYEPGNCRWATRSEQQRNTRQTRLITFNGETRCLAEWTELLGFSKNGLRNRLAKGWPVEKALTTPLRKQRRKAS
jgi:hypothetical protein